MGDAEFLIDLHEKADVLLRERNLLETKLEVLDKRLEKNHMKIGVITLNNINKEW